MGPMLNMVTWYKKHLAGWQIMQWSKKNKEITSFKKLISFLFKVPLLCLPSSKMFLYHVTVFCKGSIVHTFLGKMIQNFSFLLDIIKILKGCMDQNLTINKYLLTHEVIFFLSQIIRH